MFDGNKQNFVAKAEKKQNLRCDKRQYEEKTVIIEALKSVDRNDMLRFYGTVNGVR